MQEEGHVPDTQRWNDVMEESTGAAPDTEQQYRGTDDPPDATEDTSVSLVMGSEKLDSADVVEEGSETEEKLPLGAAAVILAICFSEGVSATILNPFCGLMVQEEFGIASADVGYWVGLLTASFFLGQLISSFPIGMAADRAGRRPVLLVGILGNIVTLSMFGLSKWMWWAMLWRFLGGVTNGNNAVVKTYIRDISTDKTQAKMYSLRSSMRGTGFLVGPIIGGFLSRPAENAPFSWVYENANAMPGIFVAFPYLFPCLVAAGLNVAMLGMGLFTLKETLVKHKKGGFSQLEEGGSEEQGTELVTIGVGDDSTLEDAGEEGAGEAASKLRIGSHAATIWREALTRNVIITIALYGIISVIWVGFQETFPVWAIREPDSSGLGFNEAQLGLVNGLCASGMVLFQAFLYTPLDHKFGTLQLFRILLVVWVPVYLAIPLCQRLVDERVLLWASLLSSMFIFNAVGTALMAGINLMINNSANRAHVGVVNGMGTFSSAGARVIAPVVSTFTFTATANLGWYFPFNYAFVFVCMACISLASIIVTLLLDTTVNKRQKTLTEIDDQELLVVEADVEANPDKLP